jgi:hypothetical protein
MCCRSRISVRQTDLLVAAGRTGRPVNVKKGQWMAPEAMLGAIEKVRESGSPDVAVTERGSFFGYGDLVVDMRSFRRMADATGAPVIYDARTACSSRAGRRRRQRWPARVHSTTPARRGRGRRRRLLPGDASRSGAGAQRCCDPVAARAPVRPDGAHAGRVGPGRDVVRA